MAKSLYDDLGISPSASSDQVRSAYRKLVLKHHPDHATDIRSKEIFMRITSAYEVLGDPERRAEYDRAANLEKKIREETRKRIREVPPEQPTANRQRPAVHEEVARLTRIYKQGRHSAAQELAHQILAEDSKQPVAYAVLGDLARSRGDMGEAAKMYAYAAQMDPVNREYGQRHLEVLDALDRKAETPPKQAAAPLFMASGAVCACGIYLVLAHEQPLMPAVSLINSFTLGLVAMALISGIALGAALGLGGFLDRFSSTAFDTFGRISPAIALGLVSLVNFWAAALFYLLAGAFQRSFQYSATRLVVSTAAILLFLGVCASLSASLNSFQTVFWGGNFVYFGSLLGWLVSDAFRN